MVLQNEFRTWQRRDSHAQAYTTLRSKTAQAIARALQISDPQQAPRCLACHSDNVPATRQGKNFALADGVGCEACHGGAKGWVGTHSRGWATRAENVRAGMYPTHEADARAHLCLSCHQSNAERSVDHSMIAAGHPRLVFELDTYTLSQPAHFRIDADYQARKPGTSSFDLWRSGQLYAASTALRQLSSHLSQPEHPTPEFSLFECAVCHQPMDGTLTSGNRISTGTPRPQTAHLLMVQALAEALAPASAAALESSTQALQQAASKGRSQLLTASRRALEVVGAVADATSVTQPSTQSMDGLLASLLRLGNQGAFSDYTAAEQAVTAVAMAGSFATVSKAAGWQAQLDRLYALIDSESSFNAQRLKQQFGQITALAGDN